LWDETPVFEMIPAYVVGYVDRRSLNFPIHEIIYRTKRETENSVSISIDQAVGVISLKNLSEHQEIKQILKGRNLVAEVNPIIDSLAEKEQHFFAHSGSMKNDWKEFVEML
jgi:hypothetical protein